MLNFKSIKLPVQRSEPEPFALLQRLFSYRDVNIYLPQTMPVLCNKKN